MLPINDNKKLSVKNYRNIIYQGIQEEEERSYVNKLQDFTVGEIKVSIHKSTEPMTNKIKTQTRQYRNSTAATTISQHQNNNNNRSQSNTNKSVTSNNQQSKSPILKESKLSNNHHNNSYSNNYNNATKSSNASQNSSKKNSFTYNNNAECAQNGHANNNSNSKSNTRSVSRRKGISLCSKEIKGTENSRHNRSVITTMGSYSNEKYQRLSTTNNPIK